MFVLEAIKKYLSTGSLIAPMAKVVTVADKAMSQKFEQGVFISLVVIFNSLCGWKQLNAI